MQDLIFVALMALVAVAVATWWLLRSSRRAALATLKLAVATTARPPGASLFLAVSTPGSSGKTALSPEAIGKAINGTVAGIARLARGLSPPGYCAGAKRRLTLAGRDRQAQMDRFFALRIITLLSIAPVFLLILVSPLIGVYRLLAFFLFTALLSLGPEALLNRAVSERQDKIRLELPAMLELLMISVEAGLGFDQALIRAVSMGTGPLSEEFSRYLGEVRMGAGHREALEAIDRRTDVDELRSLLMALVQAETFGVSVGSLLRSQAEQARTAQRQHVQEMAQKAPVKMLFPLVFCVLPALFIVVVGPAAIEIYRTLIKR